MAHQEETWIPRGWSFAFLACLTTLLGGLTITGAHAQGFDPASLSAPDRGFIQQMLETERSNVARELPASSNVVTITRTETQPQICRYFVIQITTGGQQDGVGCRLEGGLWELGPNLTQLVASGAPPAATISDGPRVEGTIGVAPGSASSSAAVTSLEIRDDPTTWDDIPLPARRPGGLGGGTTVTASAAPAPASVTTVDPAIFIRNAPAPGEDSAEVTVAAGDTVSIAAAPFDPPLPVRRPGDLTSAAIALATTGSASAPVEAQGDTDLEDIVDGTNDVPDAPATAAITTGATVTAGPAVGGPAVDANADDPVGDVVAEALTVTDDDAATPSAGIGGAQPIPTAMASVPLPGRRP